MLRIFEKILTGIAIDAQVVRTQATIANAANHQIQVTNATDASTFRPGDIVTISGTTERVQIERIDGIALFLTTTLTGTHTAGMVRIADLVAGQTRFRVDHETGLGSGIPIDLVQGTSRERVTVAQVQNGFMTLSSGLSNRYPMAVTDLPVRIQDGVTITRGDRKYRALETTIDQLAQIFNPWQTPSEFLPWLASWVDLSLQSDWSEYQQRKLIAEMVSIYQQRGLKQGLQTYLDLYSASKAKPRIVVDQGEAVFRATFAADGTAQLSAIAHSNTISLPANSGRTASRITVLLHPSAIAVDSKNNYIVADQGSDVEPTPPALPALPALWRMSSTGAIDYHLPSSASSMPMPKPIHAGTPLQTPTAVVVDNQDRYNVLDIGSIVDETNVSSAIYRFSPPDYSISTLISQSTTPKFPAVHPVDMVVDTSTRSSGRSRPLIVLDRGMHPAGFPPQGNADPKLVIISENPLAVTVQPLKKVIEPTALATSPQGHFIVADAREPRVASDSLNRPADLIRVTPSADPNAEWSQTSLLGSLPADQNPLIFPTGLAFENPQSLLVCDTGVRWRFVGDRSNRAMAEPPAIYRVDLSQNPPVITRVTDQKTLVNPTKMTFDRKGKLIMTDRGEALRLSTEFKREWRTRSNEFGVTVLFSAQRPAKVEERNRFRKGIASVIEAHKPGHVSWWLEF
jgi:phage tail-like protein